jgi:branched-chain amino acid transport system substrate-binding protein
MTAVLALSIVASMTLASCVTITRVPEGSHDDAQGADIGVVLSLSGPNQAYGNPTRAGIELALAELDIDGQTGVSIDVAFSDDEGDAETGAQRFQEHVERGISAILGPTLSNTAFVAHPVAQDAGVPVLAVTNTAEGITDTGNFIFRVSLSEEIVAPQTVEAVADAFAPETAALIFSGDDAWAASSAHAFRDAAAEHGIEIVIEEDVPADGSDFSEAIAAVGGANPDVILLSLLEHTAIGVVLEIAEQGLEQQLVCGNGCNTGTFIGETGGASDGLIVGSAWHIDSDSAQSPAFVEAYRVTYGSDPDQFSAQGYAGIQVLGEALRRAGSAEPDAIRDALAEIRDFETVLGTFSFDENRDGHHPAVIKVVSGREFEVFGS